MRSRRLLTSTAIIGTLLSTALVSCWQHEMMKFWQNEMMVEQARLPFEATVFGSQGV